MARLDYNISTIGGTRLANAVKYVIQARQEIARVKALADSLASGGTNPTALEGSQEFGVIQGQGQAAYTAIANLAANLAQITATSLADLDSGQ